MLISRRNINKAMALGTASCLVPASYSQPIGEKNEILPYRTVNVPVDRAHVLFFFDFTCPFCARLHEPFMNWAASVPKVITASALPVVNASDASVLRNQIIAARCFFAASELGNADQMRRFTNAVYENVANNVPIGSQQGWMRALKVAKMDLVAFGKGIGASKQLDKIRKAGKKSLLYQLDATPSVAIDGKYVVTPDYVAGNQEHFFTLINGLVSKILTG